MIGGAQPESDEEAGSNVLYFGEYELREKVAQGAMGTVYRARQASLNRTVAIKMIRGALLASDAEVQRFRAEAEAAASLDHPNIVPIYEIGEHYDQHYFSMKLIEGGTLADHLPELRKQYRRSASLIATVSRAIHSAHQRGILHRDLKPSNILIDHDLEPHVTDFGLAKQIESAQALTLSGQIVGTPHYMAPEQAEGGKTALTTASDLYSLGAVLYELLCGQPPFQADTVLETLRRAREEAVPLPRAQDSGIPRDLETIVLKCLRKEPGERYLSANALAEDLDRWLEGRPIEARPVRATERLIKWVKRKPVMAGLWGAVCGLVLLMAIAGPMMGLRQRKLRIGMERAELDARLELARSLEHAHPSSVPLIVSLLKRDGGSEIRQFLDEKLDEISDEALRVRYLSALAALGELRWDPLLAGLPTIPAEEGATLALALEADPVEGRRLLIDRFASSQEIGERNRVAILLLCLGDPGPAAEQLDLGPDLSTRVDFIDQFSTWHGPFHRVVPQLREAHSSDFLSGLILCLGGLEPTSFPAEERSQLLSSLDSIYRKAPDPGVHSAAQWTLERLRGSLPMLPSNRDDSNREWYVNGQGITMVGVRPGIFVPFDYTISAPAIASRVMALTEDYLISSRVIMFSEFERVFSLYAEKSGQNLNPGLLQHRKELLPIAGVPWWHSLLFCNVLSELEGLPPAYQLDLGERNVTLNPDSDGYRLPTEAEWELAARGGTETRFLTGPDAKHLPAYAQIFGDRLKGISVSRPNPLGLFDAYGGVWEYTLDRMPRPRGMQVNPMGEIGTQHSIRGGSIDAGLFYYDCSHSISQDWNSTNYRGFRVVRGAMGKSSQRLPQPLRQDLLKSSANSPTKQTFLRSDLYLAKGLWQEWGALWDGVLSKSPANGRLAEHLVGLSAPHGQWDLAGRFGALAFKQSGSTRHLLQAGLALARSPDRARYLEWRESLLAAPPSADDLLAVTRVALIHPPFEGLDQSPAVQAFAKSINREGSNNPWTAHLQAKVALRFEGPEEALRIVDQIGPTNVPALDASVLALRGLIYQRMEKEAEARKNLGAADRLVDPALEVPIQDPHWHQWLMADLLRREARAAARPEAAN